MSMSDANDLLIEPLQPHAERSRMQTEDSYGVPTADAGMLPWTHVSERMMNVRNYWVGTVRSDGRPHAVPVWGVWLDGVLYFGGGRNTRKARNLAQNPNLVIHLESGDDVVIFEGTAEEVFDDALQTRIDDAYEAKYGIRHGTPVWAVRPRKVIAWTEFPTTATRWTFSKN